MKRIDTSCYAMQIRRFNNQITGFYDRCLEDSGITVCQFTIISKLHRFRNLSVRELSDLVVLERSTLARSLKPLRENGYIVDTRQKGQRNSRLQLTEKGEETYSLAKQRWNDAQAVLEEKLGKHRIEELHEIMDILYDI